MDGVLSNIHGTDNDGIDAGSGYDQSGGNYIMWSAVQVSPTTLLVASTTATGGDTQDGVGQIDIVDISDPTNMSIVGTLDIPGTVQVTGLQLVDNDEVLVTASTGGYQQNFTSTTYGLTGDVVLATVDVTNPLDPVLLHTQVLNRASRSDAVSQSRFASLGNGLYAFSNLGASTDMPELQVINAADPQNFGTGSTDVPSDIVDLTGSGNYIYTTSADGLIIYQIAVPPPDLVTADVEVPKNTVVAGSFNIEPTQIITSDPNFDTLEWDLSLPGGGSQTLTWQSTVTDLQAGQSQTVALGATVSFTSQETPGMITLPPTMVSGAQILGLSPASQTVGAGRQRDLHGDGDQPHEFQRYVQSGRAGRSRRLGGSPRKRHGRGQQFRQRDADADPHGVRGVGRLRLHGHGQRRQRRSGFRERRSHPGGTAAGSRSGCARRCRDADAHIRHGGPGDAGRLYRRSNQHGQRR